MELNSPVPQVESVNVSVNYTLLSCTQNKIFWRSTKALEDYDVPGEVTNLKITEKEEAI